MKPKNFKECNIVFGASQPEYQPLPALKDDNNPQGTTVVHCWELSEEELLKLIDTRELWVSVLTFNKPIQPIYITVEKSDVININ